jgi:hypothetical protein
MVPPLGALPLIVIACRIEEPSLGLGGIERAIVAAGP